jgi:hypothetical protein
MTRPATGATGRMTHAPLPKSRVLVLIADEICGRCLARELTDRGEGAAGTVVIMIAPALVHSATAAWTDDIDASIAEAERKVDASVALLRRQGYATVGKVGDSNPIRAIEDGLAEFAPDSVIVATHPVAPHERGYVPGRTRKSGLQADDRRATATEHR